MYIVSRDKKKEKTEIKSVGCLISRLDRISVAVNEKLYFAHVQLNACRVVLLNELLIELIFFKQFLRIVHIVHKHLNIFTTHSYRTLILSDSSFTRKKTIYMHISAIQRVVKRINEENEWRTFHENDYSRAWFTGQYDVLANAARDLFVKAREHNRRRSQVR